MAEFHILGTAIHSPVLVLKVMVAKPAGQTIPYSRLDSLSQGKKHSSLPTRLKSPNLLAVRAILFKIPALCCYINGSVHYLLIFAPILFKTTSSMLLLP
jgi:hypothetical protein